jgi:hypothetical protein
MLFVVCSFARIRAFDLFIRPQGWENAFRPFPTSTLYIDVAFCLCGPPGSCSYDFRRGLLR